jgi:transcriptional regulator with XRE-family HTH domain
MPFENEHSARLVSPGRFQDFRRNNDQFGAGIDAIFGIRMEAGERVSELQAIRFDKDRFTVAQARTWLEEHEFEPILFEPATESMQEASHLSGMAPLADGSCPAGYPVKRRGVPGGPLRCFRRTSESGADVAQFLIRVVERKKLTAAEVAQRGNMSASATSAVLRGEVNKPGDACLEGFAKALGLSAGRLIALRDRNTEAVVESGVHEHPHDFNGIHDHLGLPPATGGHGHLRDPSSGGHVHREGDPIEGFHLGDPVDQGQHVHILAQKDRLPDLFKWYQDVIDAHWPTYAWLEFQVATWVSVLIEDGIWSEPRQANRDDFSGHCLWSFHSAGANLQQHLAAHLDPDTRFLRLWYEFADGEIVEATADDFREEVAWFDEHLPFPEDMVRAALENQTS